MSQQSWCLSDGQLDRTRIDGNSAQTRLTIALSILGFGLLGNRLLQFDPTSCLVLLR